MARSDVGAAYAGNELELFADARNWKRYWSGQIGPFIGSRVLEVGAGIGSNTRIMNDGTSSVWECVEPDPAMAARLVRNVECGDLPANVRIGCGTIASAAYEPFDTIVYIDVLEHIEDDRSEIAAATAKLAPGGHLIVLAPAHGWLFSPFDAAIGHFRRYTRSSLLALSDPRLDIVRCWYVDSAGLLASLANALVLRAAAPTVAQIRFWDSVVVPVSRVTDRLTASKVGKTVIAIWRKR